jgi:hypothetical protein
LLRSNGQGLLIEDPCLVWSSVSGLDDKVSIESSEVSPFTHSRDNVEWSFDVQTESLVEFTLLWISLPLISIDNIPLLRSLVLSVLDVDVSTFLINITLYPSNLVVLDVSKVSTLHLEHLPPS